MLTHRKLLAASLAAALAMSLVPAGAEAAWRGLSQFDCENSRSNWNFDGLYGRFTTRAIKNFQQARGITADGIAGPETHKALGLKYHRTLRCGMGGNDVYLVQQALASGGFWYGGVGQGGAETPPVPVPGISARPMPRATPMWTEPPTIFTPMPVRPPTAAPEVTPMPMSAESPNPEDMVPPENRPTVELKAGNWSVPRNAGSTNYDFTFARPVWTGEAGLWFGDVGLGGGLTLLNETYTDFRRGVYFANQTMVLDGLLKYRWEHGYYNVFAGYRGIGLADVNFGTVGFGIDQPLAGRWLWLQAKAQGGHNFSKSYFLDGNAGLALRFEPLTLGIGFRHLAFQNLADPMVHLNGPTADVRLAF